MMQPALSAKNTDTTPTVTTKDDDDDTSSPQLLMDDNVMENKTFSDFKMPADATTDDDTGATASMDEEEDDSIPYCYREHATHAHGSIDVPFS